MLRNKYVQIDPKISEPLAGLALTFAFAIGIVFVLLATTLWLDS